MDIGIFSRTFARPSLDKVLDAILATGLTHVHFNPGSAGVASLPEQIDDTLCRRVRQAFDGRGLTMTSVSGTFNAIHPEAGQRAAGIARARHLIDRCRGLGTAIVTLCTGSRDATGMWRRHPGNYLPEAWSDLLSTLSLLLPAAERNGVTLGIEPEVNNVVGTARQARRLLNELRSPRLKIILDGANLFETAGSATMPAVLAEAFDLLAPDVVMLHAKDLADPPSHPSQAAGKGRLDWNAYMRLIAVHRLDVPVILHNLDETEVPDSVSFVKDRLSNALC